MKRIIVICEGQTEQQFCNDVLQPYFSKKNIYIDNPTIKKTGGGIVNWEALKNQIKNHLKNESKAIVTTLIDFYGIHEHHNYPNWSAAKKETSKSLGITNIENGMLKDIDSSLNNRFIPYVQLHEFEALLFSDINVYHNNFEANEFLDYNYLIETITKNPNPEDINDSPETAPSKRLSKIIKGYFSNNENTKVLYGSLLAQEIGLQNIREKCPRFNNWILNLESI